MPRDEIFRNQSSIDDFKFTKEVSDVFDDMLERSVPFYREIVRMIAELSETFYQKDTVIYDLGASTGNILQEISAQMGEKAFRYTGIDNSASMVEQASSRDYSLSGGQSADFVEGDIADYNYKNASVIISAFTFQFLRPMVRSALVRDIYSSLKPGGAFILAEKVLEDHSEVSRLFVEYYYRFKRRNHYSETEIARKREALENVLIPYRSEENAIMLKEAGFHRQAVFFKWYNFTGIVGIKEA